MKATAKAYSNIALVKYWGNHNNELRLPLNNTISFNLDNSYTITTVEFSPEMASDIVYINAQMVDGEKLERVVKHLNIFREKSKISYKAKVMSKNSFPMGSGIASSASGFAALTVACDGALGLNLSEKELSCTARLGAGSAARSIPGGFVEWLAADKNEDSYAYQIAPPEHMDICDIVAIVSESEKKVGSTSGHKIADTSLYHPKRLEIVYGLLPKLRKAISEKDIDEIGRICELDAIGLHFVAMTSQPQIFYFKPETIELLSAIPRWREEGIIAYFTTDAGPNVHIITNSKNKDKVLEKLSGIPGVIKYLVNKPTGPAHRLEEHLF